MNLQIIYFQTNDVIIHFNCFQMAQLILRESICILRMYRKWILQSICNFANVFSTKTFSLLSKSDYFNTHFSDLLNWLVYFYWGLEGVFELIQPRAWKLHAPLQRTRKFIRFASAPILMNWVHIEDFSFFDYPCNRFNFIEKWPFPGVRVAGYRIRKINGFEHWTLIGQHDPLEPQMFYPVAKNMIIQKGDVLVSLMFIIRLTGRRIRWCLKIYENL